MSGRIPRLFIDDLLLRVDLVDLIDSYLPLKKTGSNFVARCPFHSEKTPSFSVSRDKQLYYCFGCGASGNAISFLMDYNHLDFVEAVEDLASYAGVKVPREQFDASRSAVVQKDLGAVYGVMQQAADFYVQCLLNSPEAKKAADYLQRRGVSAEIAKEFMLGYASAEWQALSKRFAIQSLQDAGLVVTKEGGKNYDRFRGRLMFPIRDKRGRVIAFGGRVLDDSVPKYLNSPETEVFHKGREVYGLYELLRKQNKPQRIIVVEGYLDVIALHQFGIHYAVATLGTAVSKAHMELLFRFASELVFCFDGDAAGLEAAWRAMDAALPCLKGGRQVRIMLLPQDSDPDTLIREIGVERFVEKIFSAPTLSEYFFNKLSANLNLNVIEGRAALVEKVRPYLDKLPQGVYREMMFARLMEMAQNNVLKDSENVATINRNGYNRTRQVGRQKLSPLRTAIGLLLRHPELAERVRQKPIDWKSLELPGIELFGAILRRIWENPRVTVAGLMEGFRGLPEEKQVQALARQEILIPNSGTELEFDGALERLLEQGRENKLALLIAKDKEKGLEPQEKALLLKLLKRKV
ncbi:MAG: DNA primase [Gammaproteobacteria bacterium]